MQCFYFLLTCGYIESMAEYAKSNQLAGVPLSYLKKFR